MRVTCVPMGCLARTHRGEGVDDAIVLDARLHANLDQVRRRRQVRTNGTGEAAGKDHLPQLRLAALVAGELEGGVADGLVQEHLDALVARLPQHRRLQPFEERARAIGLHQGHHRREKSHRRIGRKLHAHLCTATAWYNVRQ